ncbi:MAG: hypothetical protein CME64_06320 [Halobacteriovoraceae bacterium]|nr:hypothetical protein [Halobacteriovoraceae bacterium]|tara:strand:- start:83817 stop:84389 length:573 start_codon:yes stop_codon:yes gene_type:complete
MKVTFSVLLIGTIISSCVRIEKKKYTVPTINPKVKSAEEILESLYKTKNGIECELENQDSLETNPVFIVGKTKIDEQTQEEKFQHSFYTINDELRPSLGINLNGHNIDFLTYEESKDQIYTVQSYAVSRLKKDDDDKSIISAKLTYDKKIEEIGIKIIEQKFDGTQMVEEEIGHFKINGCQEAEKKILDI